MKPYFCFSWRGHVELKQHSILAQDKHFIAKFNALLSSMNVKNLFLKVTRVDIYKLSILQHFMLHRSCLN